MRAKVGGVWLKWDREAALQSLGSKKAERFIGFVISKE
jgi:hypothetical protein